MERAAYLGAVRHHDGDEAAGEQALARHLLLRCAVGRVEADGGAALHRNHAHHDGLVRPVLGDVARRVSLQRGMEREWGESSSSQRKAIES
jgi:hypothetical protein